MEDAGRHNFDNQSPLSQPPMRFAQTGPFSVPWECGRPCLLAPGFLKHSPFLPQTLRSLRIRFWGNRRPPPMQTGDFRFTRRP